MSSYIFYVIILIVAIVGFTVQQVPDADFSAIRNMTWNSSAIDIQIESQPELGNVVNTFVNAGGEILFSIVRWSVDIAEANPNVSWKLIIYLVFAAILAPIAIALFKLVVIIVILIREFIQRKKEKKDVIRNSSQRLEETENTL